MLFKASCAPVLTRWIGPLLSRTHIRLNGCAQSMHTCPEAAQKNGRLPKKQARVRTFPMERARFFGQLMDISGGARDDGNIGFRTKDPVHFSQALPPSFPSLAARESSLG